MGEETTRPRERTSAAPRRVVAWTRAASARLGSGALRLLFPRTCPACDALLDASCRHVSANDAHTDRLGAYGAAWSDIFCATCAALLEPMGAPGTASCPLCAAPRVVDTEAPFSDFDDLCDMCIARRPAFVEARACWHYAGPVQAALQRAKYGRDLHALDALARALAPWLRATLDALAEEHGLSWPLLTIAPPSSAQSLAQRGFNPAALLLERARTHASMRRHLDAHHTLLRRTRGGHQAGRGWSARMRAQDTFQLASTRSPSPLTGADVLLFDDVITTSATAHDLAWLLREQGGAARVFVLAAARTPARV